MKNATYLYIHQPCHEDWDKMTPENKGRFCASCAKSVVDFSLMTDNEVLAYLSKNTGNLCGRFDAEQLQRPLLETQLQPKKNWKYWLASLSALFLLTNKSTAQTNNSNKINASSVVVPDKENIQLGEVFHIKQNKLLEGTVTDTMGKPLVGASLTINELQISTITDSIGKFLLHKANLPDTFTLIVSYVGYEKKEVFVNKTNAGAQVIKLKQSAKQLLDVTVIGYKTVGRLSIAGGLTRCIIPRKVTVLDTIISKVFSPVVATIYPNPVNKNSHFHLSIADAGEYEVQLLDNKSRLYYVQKHTTLSPKEIIDITVPPNAASGLYYIRLVNTATQKQWVDKLVVL